MDSRYLTKEFIIEFLGMYKSLECLWKTKSRDYSNRQKRDKAYELLVEKLKQVDSTASRLSVVKKIDSFRGSFRKELKKIENSKLHAQDPKQVYRSKLWYFDLLLFLVDQDSEEKCDNSSSKPVKNEALTQNEGEEYYLDEAEYEALEEDQSTDITVLQEEPLDTNVEKLDSSQNISYQPSCKRKKVDDSPQYVLKRIPTQFEIEEDEYTVMGRNIANKLRKLLPDQAIIAEKLITDILFEAKMGNIDKFSRIVIQDCREAGNKE